MKIAEPLTLPCGVTLKNRLCKSAMTEGLAGDDDNPNQKLETLYKRWESGGAGILMTGNVMVDRRFLERPGNVVLDEDTDLGALERWAQSASGTQLWMQINHPGRQCARTVTNQPLAPSPVGLKLAGMFAQPRALTEDEIQDVIRRFVWTAKTAIERGFGGVQIHSAHGYLSSQFLSPKTNQRDDKWGGSLENRARFLLSIVEQTRDALGPSVPISVKLNSADFSKGGFDNDDAKTVAGWVAERGIDLLEISGGTYERTAFFGEKQAESTAKREAYFLEFAELIRDTIDVPLMVTGGFRTRKFMNQVLDDGLVDVIGIARPFCVAPDLANQMIDGDLENLPTPEADLSLGAGFFGPASGNTTMRGLNSQVGSAWFYRQIYRLADGHEPDVSLGSWGTLFAHFWRDQTKGFSRGKK